MYSNLQTVYNRITYKLSLSVHCRGGEREKGQRIFYNYYIIIHDT